MVDTGLELLSRGILKNGPIPASFLFLFVLLTLQFKLKISTQLELYKAKKSVDFVLGSRTWGCRMVGRR